VKVTALVHFYVPFRCAGSETMLHTMLKALADKGHEIQVIATSMPEAPFQYTYDGVRVTATNTVWGQQLIKEYGPDLIVSHHQNTKIAARISRKLRVPWVFLVHNDFAETKDQLAFNPDLTVFNTDWIASNWGELVRDWTVVHPPVWPAEHATSPGNKVTLVNMTDLKGGRVLQELARRMPEVEFLGVVGGYGDQIVTTTPNLEITPHTDDMKNDVWSRTRILLMPSWYESYGMAGVEALASGIPVIAAPTPGLLESQGPTGIFVDRDDIDGYEAEIRRLLDPIEWAKASELALARSADLDPAIELRRWVESAERLVDD
jgi:hypothetical protein